LQEWQKGVNLPPHTKRKRRIKQKNLNQRMTGSEEKNLRINAYGKQQVEVSLLIGKEPGKKKKQEKRTTERLEPSPRKKRN